LQYEKFQRFQSSSTGTLETFAIYIDLGNMDANNTIKTISYITLFVMAVYLILNILDVDNALISFVCVMGYFIIDCFIIAYNASEKKKKSKQEEQ
jgi:hypothetical protein